MSKFFYTSTELLASIKRRALVPESQITFTDQDFLNFATEEMNMGIVPTVIEAQQDYYLDEKLIPLVNGKLKYEIPYRAIGNKLRDVSFVNSNGDRRVMTRAGLADQVYSGSGSNEPYAYFMTGNEINLMNTSSSNIEGSSLAVSYYLRPNSLVPNDEVGIITAIDTTTGGVTLSATPTAFVVNVDYDFIQFKSPHKILNYDIVATIVNNITNVITFDPASLPSNLAIGDRVSLATETCIPQIPSDMHVMLAVRVASQILAALGDVESLQTSNQKLAELEIKTKTLITDRVEDSPMKIINRSGTLRRGKR